MLLKDLSRQRLHGRIKQSELVLNLEYKLACGDIHHANPYRTVVGIVSLVDAHGFRRLDYANLFPQENL